MNQQQIDELKRLAEAATPGPWKADEGERVKIDYPTLEEYGNSLAVFSAKPYSAFGLIPHGILYKPDAAFIAAAREAVPALIAEVERLQALVDSVEWGDDAVYCPWCHGSEWNSGHRPGCPAFPPKEAR